MLPTTLMSSLRLPCVLAPLLLTAALVLPALGQQSFTSKARQDIAALRAQQHQQQQHQPSTDAPPLPHLPQECVKRFLYEGRPHPQCHGALRRAMDPEHGDPRVVDAILHTYPDQAEEMLKTTRIVLRIQADRKEFARKYPHGIPQTHTFTHTWRDRRGVRHTSTTVCTATPADTTCYTE